MKLIIQPRDGVSPLLSAIKGARKSIDIAIFRFDRKDVENALTTAAKKGVKVTALIAHTNRGGEKNLRKLELRFLEAGIIVARSADDLVRYHDKYIVIDSRVLYVLSFNFTHLDIDHSRGFGIVTKNTALVQEAKKLFTADCTRTPYTAGMNTFVVSPANSRAVLGTFMKRAKKQLLIYDPKISDREMVRILQKCAKDGIEVRIIGKISGRANLESQKLAGSRLHTRTIIRDRHQAFIGSQSLRPAELDSRRELGIIVKDKPTLKKLVEMFDSDWISQRKDAPEKTDQQQVASKMEESQKEAEALEEKMDPLADTVKKAVKKAVSDVQDEQMRDGTMKEAVKKVVKKAMKEAVREAVQASDAK